MSEVYFDIDKAMLDVLSCTHYMVLRHSYHEGKIPWRTDARRLITKGAEGDRVMKAMNWMKRIVCLMLVCVMLVATALPALAVGHSSTLAKKGDKYYVIASGLHVRKSAEMGDNIKTSIKKGKKVEFRYEENGWWYVKYGSGKYGFVDKQYLTRANVRKKGTYRTTAYLNVRSFPRDDAKILGTLKKKAKVKILQLNGDWCRINYKGHEGWIAAKYLKK